MTLVIAFDGISGAGKTTCAKIVVPKLTKLGISSIVINEKEQEPFKSWVAGWHRREKSQRWFSRVDVKELASARHLVHMHLSPRFAEHDVVVFDRSVWTSVVYQSSDICRCADILAENIAAGIILPQLNFIFVADPALCAKRVVKRAAEKSLYHLPALIEDEFSIRKSYKKYLEILAIISNCHLIDGSRSAELNADEVTRIIVAHIKHLNAP